MYDTSSWDWDVGKRLVADINRWEQEYEWVEEPQASPDGERVAAVVKSDDMEFTVAEERDAKGPETWEDVFDKVTSLNFGPDNRLSALVSDTGDWTVGVDGSLWENSFDFAWDIKFSLCGGKIAVTAQKDREYFPVVNDTPWENRFFMLNNVTLSADGENVAAAVQTVPTKEGEIFKFQNGCFAAALDGKAWDRNFVNVWGLDFSKDGKNVAAEVRTSLYDYTIAVNGVPWERSFASVWKPLFQPGTDSVMAPVKIGTEWFLAKDGEKYWDNGFVQLWHHFFSPENGRTAAIVATDMGRWTIARNGTPWLTTFGELVTDGVFSPDGNSVACLGKEKGMWHVVVDGRAWEDSWDMAWKPVFSPDGKRVAARVEKRGKYTLVIDGKPVRKEFSYLWDPIFSPDSDKILIRSIGAGKEAGKYNRQVLDVEDFLACIG